MKIRFKEDWLIALLLLLGILLLVSASFVSLWSLVGLAVWLFFLSNIYLPVIKARWCEICKSERHLVRTEKNSQRIYQCPTCKKESCAYPYGLGNGVGGG